MHRLPILLGALTLGLAAPRGPAHDEPAEALKEERAFIEYTPQHGEAVVVFEAESEVGLQRVEVRSPQGDSALSLRSTSVGGRSISGFVVETTEAPLPDVLAAYAEGRYDIVARTHSGHAAVGSALLVHALLDQPAITYPAAGARGVSTSGLTVTWAADPLASGYTVILEQDDNDGLTIELPPGSSSLVVPEGFLQPATETLLEVGVIGPNGNRTVTEVPFTTL
jgi:hypothetical protein